MEALGQGFKLKKMDTELLTRCNVCKDDDWMDRVKYEMHIASHADKENSKCTICDKKFVHFSSVWNHIRQQHSMRKLSDVPEAVLEERNTSQNEISVAQQIRRQMAQQSQQYYCKFPRCGFSAKRSYELRNHVSLVHSALRSTYRCAQCNYNCKHKTSLHMHVRVVHRRETILMENRCMHCTMAFATERKLDGHLRIVHNKAINKFVCDICPFFASFETETELEIHSKNLHLQENKHDDKIKYREEIDRKVQLIIESQGASLMFPKLPLYQCGQCHEILSSEIDLEEHAIEQHTTNTL